MRTIVAGSRDGVTYQMVVDAINEAPFRDRISAVVCGDARGADLHGAAWARQKGLPVAHYPADWQGYGRGAGYIRNRKMAHEADALIAVHCDGSKGTAHMIAEARKCGLPVFVVTYKDGQRVKVEYLAEHVGAFPW